MGNVALRFMKTEYKRSLLAFPKLILGSFFFLGLLFALLFLLTKSLYQSGELPMTKIAVVNEDTELDSSLTLSYLESFRSVSSLFTFTEVSKEEAQKQLASGQVIAVIELPSGTLTGILNGENLPVSVTFSNAEGLPAALLAELTKSGASLLGSAQSAVYTAADLYNSYGLSIDLQTLFDTLNRRGLHIVFLRESLFHDEIASATGTLRVPVFYGATLLLLFFLCCGTLYHVQFQENDAVRNIWIHMGLSPVSHTLIRLSVIFVQNLLAAVLPILAINLTPLAVLFSDAASLPWSLLLLMAPLLLFSALEVFCFTVPRRGSEGILWLFFSGLGMTLFCGLLLPSAFLPKLCGKTGPFLPVFWCHRIFCSILDQSFRPEQHYSCFCLIGALILLSASILFTFWKTKRYTT
ncbi:MAG: ABC transporter permease [Clostridiales bacterium]|nr:ABC transporter permease [Clostridiales bacterium]